MLVGVLGGAALISKVVAPLNSRQRGRAASTIDAIRIACDAWADGKSGAKTKKAVKYVKDKKSYQINKRIFRWRRLKCDGYWATTAPFEVCDDGSQVAG
jgi:hypothetical protein